MRLTFLTLLPSPYMMDLFNAIHQDSRFHLQVHLLEKPALAAPGIYWQEKPLPPYASVLPGGWFNFFGARIHVNTGLFRALAKERPDLVVVMGYGDITCQLAMHWLSFKRIPWVFWGELPGFERRGIFSDMLRWLALRPVAHMADGVAAIGSRAAAACANICKRNCPISNIPYYCDNDMFLKIERKPTCEAAHFLYCGQIVPRKGVDLLLRSFCRLAETRQEVRLTLVGDGPQRAALARTVPDVLRRRVNWAGFKEVDALAPFFAEANVFVLPSLHDGWGVVVNQAISAGMAVIASDAVGAAVDLVGPHANGLIFPSQNEAELTDAMRYLANSPELIAHFGLVSRAKARRLAPRHGVESWYRFSQFIVGARHRGAEQPQLRRERDSIPHAAAPPLESFVPAPNLIDSQ